MLPSFRNPVKIQELTKFLELCWTVAGVTKIFILKEDEAKDCPRHLGCGRPPWQRVCVVP